MPIVYQNQKIVFTPDRTFDNMLEVVQYMSEYLGGARLEEDEGVMVETRNLRIGSKVYYLGYEVDFPFVPYDFFVFEGVKERDWSGHPQKYHSFYVADFMEGGVAFFWYEDLERGRIHYTHMTDDEYVLLQRQKEAANKEDCWNAFSILAEHSKAYRIPTGL